MNHILPLLTILSLMIWFFLYWEGGLALYKDIHTALVNSRTPFDAPLLIAATLLGGGIMSTGIWMSISAPTGGLLPALFQFLGFPLTLIGIFGMFHCRRFLGKYWTPETGLQSNHKIISSGPYRFVRHPIYTYAIMTYFGAGLVFSSWWNLILVTAIIIVYVAKTYDEDTFLIQNLSGYAKYAKRVHFRLILGLW